VRAVAKAPGLTGDDAAAAVRVPVTQWFTVNEAAAYARVGKRTIYTEIRAGRLRAARIGGRKQFRLTPQWMDEWLINSATPTLVQGHGR
jgi:excisionase family DNA binding protein